MVKTINLIFLLISLYSFAQTEENISIKFDGVYTNNITCRNESENGNTVTKVFIKFSPDGKFERVPVVCTVTVNDTKNWDWFTVDDPADNELVGSYKIDGTTITLSLDEGRQLIGKITNNGIMVVKRTFFIEGSQRPHREYDHKEVYTFRKV